MSKWIVGRLHFRLAKNSCGGQLYILKQFKTIGMFAKQRHHLPKHISVVPDASIVISCNSYQGAATSLLGLSEEKHG